MTTMKDVAQAANVSLSTVSYVLNQTRPISDQTRAKVMAAIDELGYTRNAAARTLAGRRSHVLALVLPQMAGSFGATISEFVEAATLTASEHGYTLVIWPFGDEDYAKVDLLVQQRLADGVLVMEVTMDDQRIQSLERSHVPFTMIGRTRNLDGRSWVDIDFAAATSTALDRLEALGHRHVALLNHSPAMLQSAYGPAVRTRDAFLEQTRQRRMSGFHIPCKETALDGHIAAEQILTHDPDTTAVITLNETATIGLVAGMMTRHRSVPTDMSVIGIATSPAIAAMTVPALSAFQAPGHDLGRAAVQELVAVLDNETHQSRPRLLTCPFADGESLALAPRPQGADA